MILVTVGTQAPFDRLVHAVDRWAAAQGRQDILAQTGPTMEPPTHIDWQAYLDAGTFAQRFAGAEVVVAHAGIGTILRAAEIGQPLLVMPRRAHLREHRNDHQLATVASLQEILGLTVAEDEYDLAHRLEHLHEVTAPTALAEDGRAALIDTVRGFLDDAAAPNPHRLTRWWRRRGPDRATT
jgi:exopolysaccharide biosynthesis glucuronosyltransferase PssE